jgi:8-oxo-dGTP pyrophosphatase MutT (NUDIX family)
MAEKRKREKVRPAKVPPVLFAVVSERDLERAVARGQLRGTKSAPLAFYAKPRSAKSRNAKGTMIRVAAHAASQSGTEFFRGAKDCYEATKVPLSFVGCQRLPKAIKGVERVDAAGGVVVVGGDRPRVLLLLKGGEKRGRWVLPKGKRRPSEARRGAARREVIEETGLEKVTVKRFLLRESYFDRERGKTIYKEVSYFLMRCPKAKAKIKPNGREGFTRGSWMSFDAAISVTSAVRAHRPIRKARAGLKGS